jgi:hypothetical protein
MGLIYAAGLWVLSVTWLSSEAEVASDLLRRLTAAQIPTERLDDDLRARVDSVLKNGQLYTRGPTECFPCQPAVYRWLLDHPHWGLHAWRALGATRLRLEQQPDGSFIGSDAQGSELRWRTIVREPGRRAWYAEGSGRLAPLLPVVSVRAVVLLKFQEVQGEDGRFGIRQRTEIIALYDGKAAELASKLLGISAETAGKKASEQLGLFFSGMAWYLTEHPEWGLSVLKPNVDALDRSAWEQIERQLQPLARQARPASRGNAAQPSLDR